MNRFTRLLTALFLALAFAAPGAQQVINVGTVANDGTGDSGRAAFQKSNANFTELYARPTITAIGSGLTLNLGTLSLTIPFDPASPGTIGGTTPAAASFTTISASSTLSGAGFTSYFASPPAIGSTAANTGAFTTLSASGQITSTLATGTAPLVIASTTNVPNLNASSLNGATFASPGAIGATAAGSGAFTTVSTTGAITLGGDAILQRDAANYLAMRNGTNSTKFSVSNTFTDASNYRRLALIGSYSGTATGVITEGLGTGAAAAMYVGTDTAGNLHFRSNNTNRWQIDGTTGAFVANADNTYGIGGTSLAATGGRPLFINVGTSGLAFDRTNTAGGTTGAQTINKSAGSVNFAASATSLVVTNSLVTATSNIIATVSTNDGTLKSVQAVPAAGSFTLFANAAATAETRVVFLVTN